MKKFLKAMTEIKRVLCLVDEHGYPKRWVSWTPELAKRHDTVEVPKKGDFPSIDDIEEAKKKSNKESEFWDSLAKEITSCLDNILPPKHLGRANQVEFTEKLITAVGHYKKELELEGTPSGAKTEINWICDTAEKIELTWDKAVDDGIAQSAVLQQAEAFGTTPDELRMSLNRLIVVLGAAASSLPSWRSKSGDSKNSQKNATKNRIMSPKKEARITLLVKIGEAIELCIGEKAKTGEDGLLMSFADTVMEVLKLPGVYHEDLVDAVRRLRYQKWATIQRQIVRIEFAIENETDPKVLAALQIRAEELKKKLWDNERTLPSKTVEYFRKNGANWKISYQRFCESLS